MKIPFVASDRARGISRGVLTLAFLSQASSFDLQAAEIEASPVLEFASGLSGKQVRLTWLTEAGVKYRIERSSTLAAAGAGGWTQVALVEATAAETSWTDPEATTTENFYRISQPVAEVFAISPPIISTTGGELVISGQGIPAGSFLTLELDGQTLQIPLISAGGGMWDASVVGQFLEDSNVIATGIFDSSGTPVVSLNLPITVTATGRALDAPASLPPAAPVPQMASNPIPGVGIVVKRNPGSSTARMGGGKVSLQDFHFLQAASGGGKGRATFKEFTLTKRPGNPINIGSVTGGGGAGKASFKEFTVTKKTDTASINIGSVTGGGGAGKATFKEFTVTKRPGHNINIGSVTGGGGAGKASFKEFTVTKKTDTAVMMSHSDQFTPQGIHSASVSPLLVMWLSKRGYDYYQAKSDMNASGMHSNPFFNESQNTGDMPVHDNSGLPGEVRIPVSALSLSCPAGPNIDWVCTYRSMVPVSSGHGPGWDFSYNISIEPLPAGAAATRVAIRDGQGRRDIFHRQPDGSFTCPGMFREGRFDGETFTLTFADTGKWVFLPLNDRFAPGKISTIADRNAVVLTCSYDPAGKLRSVSSQFGQSISVAFTGDQISGLTDHAGRAVSFSYYGSGVPGGSEGDLLSITCPQDSGQPPAAGPLSFTYSTGSPDPRLNGNLLSATDGAGRLLGAFTYSSATDPLHIDFDTCASAGRFKTGHVTLNRRELLSPGVSPKGGYTSFEIDEIGRVSETVCDRMHRPVSCKVFTGFSTPNVPVTSSSNRPSGKLRASDPDFFETTCAYNADSLCTRLTHPDGSQEVTTYDRDFRRDCPVREGGNPRVMTLRTAGGEERSVTCDYLPGFGSHRTNSPGHKTVNEITLRLADGGITAVDDWETPVVRVVSAHGQVTTCGYDTQGNLTSITSPVPGRGSLYQYNGLGQLTSATILNGSGPSFTDTCAYDSGPGFLGSVVSDSGGLDLTTTFAHDALGRVIRVIDPRGNDELHGYNALDQIVEIQSPPVPERIASSFHYDAAGTLARCDVEHRGADGQLDSANPAYSSFLVYDDHGQLVRTAEEERPVDGSSVLVPDTLGIENFAACDLTLNDAGECVRLSTPAACRAQATDLVCDFTFDERGMLHRIHDGGTGNSAAVTTECDYDLFGAMTRCAVIGQGVVSESLATFDGFHRLSSETDPMGNACYFKYGNDGYATCSVFGEVNDVPGSADNVLLSKTSSKSGYTTRRRVEVLKSNRTQNPNGTPAVGDPFGGGDVPLEAKGWTRIKNKGSLEARTAFFGVETEDETITCDRFTVGGEIIPEVTVIDRSPAGLVQQISRNGDVLETCAYDSAGRLASSSNGACTLAVNRDANGQVLLCGKTDHFRIPGTPDKTFSVIRVLDALGRCIQSTDGSGNVSTCAYDSLGRPVSATEPGGLQIRATYDGSSPTGPFSSQVSADADGNGDFETLSSSFVRCGELRHTEDSYGHRTSFTRDAVGRETRCDHPDTTFEEWSFDSLGRYHQWRCQDESLRTTNYDLNGRPTLVTWTSPPTITPPAPASYVYSGLGECVLAEQGASVMTFTHDSLGNPTSEDSNGQTIVRTFNHRGRTGITYPDGRRFVENRDTLGQPLSISALDPVGLPVSPPVVVMQYAGERVWRSTQANGVVSTFTYRGDGEAALPGAPDASFDSCVRVTVTDAASSLLSQTTYRRDANQLETRCDTLFTASQQGPGRSREMTRDLLGRVTSSLTRRREVPGGPVIIESDISHTLDLEGRRLSTTGGQNPGPYTQDSTLPPGDQQMGQYTTWPGGQLAWDPQGNLSSIQRGSVAHQYVHDAGGRLLSVTDPSTGTVLLTCSYDAAGRRISSTVSAGGGLPPVSTQFVYDGSECVQELGDNGTGQVDAAVTFVASGGVKHCISTRNGTLYYPAGNQADHWGDPHENLNGRYALMTTATGQPSERFDCDDAGLPVFLGPDGAPTASSSPIGPIRWMAPEAMWESSIGMFLGDDNIYCPELGMTVSRHKGHVTVLKAAARGGGHVTVLKAAAKGGGHVTVLKAAAGGGMGGGGGSGKAQDHNSSRSNKSG